MSKHTPDIAGLAMNLLRLSVKAPSGVSVALRIVLRDIRKRRAIARIERLWAKCARRI